MRAEHGIADRNQRVLHLQAVPPLHLVARERLERLAHEVAVRDLDDRVRLLVVARHCDDRRAEALHEERNPRVVDAPHRVDAKRDLQVVAAEHRVFAGEVLGVGVRRHADVRHVEQPGSSGRRRPFLDAVEPRLPEYRALGEIADVARGRERVPRSEEPDDGQSEAKQRGVRRERRRRQGDARTLNGRAAK